MPKLDFEKVLTLLHVAEKAQQWPTLHHVRDQALKELAEMGVEEKKLDQPKNEEPPKGPKTPSKGDA